MSSSFVQTLRTGVFAFVILTSFILLILCAHSTSTTTREGFYLPFMALGIATSLLAILTLPVMLVVDKVRKSATTSMIIVEISWLGLLWILFLATAGNASQADPVIRELCSTVIGREILDLGTVCHEYQPIQAFAYLTWLALLAYVLVLSVLGTRLANRGYPKVWYQSVQDTNFDAPAINVAPMFAQQYIPPQQVQTQYPAQQPVTGWAGTPQQVPATSNLGA